MERLVARPLPSDAAMMFTVSEAEAAAIRAAFEQGGEFAAAREGARTIAAWRPLQVRKNGRVKRPRLGKGR
jgi:hypothetical protein